MFQLALPWWEFVIRGAACYLGLLILLRATGKRAFGEMSPFDIVVLIIVGGALRSAMVGQDASLIGPLISVVTILGLDKLLGWLCAASPFVDRLLEGDSVLLARDGKLVRGSLLKHSISRAAFERELRANRLRSLASVEEARLEANGRITIVEKSAEGKK